MAASLYFSHPACLEHDPRQGLYGHPEQPGRLRAIEAALAERDWLGWERREAPRATEEELALVHPRTHVEAIRTLCESGGGPIDGDTFASEASWEAALRAAGGACEMVRQLLHGDAGLGFCAVRPPGHHAEPERAMGFCLFDNVAVAAALALAELGVERVLIVDWDVHHGNGTEALVEDDPTIRYVSMHQWPWYPGTGSANDRGVGNVFNVPREPGLPRATYVKDLWDAIAAASDPAAFVPDLVILSAGYDSLAGDPLGGFTLEPADFATLTTRIRDRFPDAPVVGVLEGGYAPERLADGVVATVGAM
ncbi:MAG TPA: histone deacetylase [Solirubrobacterales bacterium]|nr:histone deacetylase [Solirubrobacterales bacterium]